MLIHGSPRRVVIAPPAGGAVHQGGVEAGQGGGHPCAQIGDERSRVGGLADRGVVHLAGGVEVTGQVVVRVAPPVRARDVDLAAAQRVAQRDQHAQLIRDPLDPAAVIDDRVAPGPGHHTVDRDGIGVGEEPGLAVHAGVAGQQRQRSHHRPVGGVVAAELQRGEQRRQHPAVVVGVRAAQHRADPGLEGVLVGPGLAYQLAQRLLPDHREQRRPDRVVRVRDGGLRESEQDRFLAAHPAQVLSELALHAAVGACVDPVDQPNQQLDQRVGDLRRPQRAQRDQQRQPHRPRRRTQIRGIGTHRAGPPRLDQLLARVDEQPGR